MSFRESGKTTEMWTLRDILYIVILSIVGGLYSTFSPLGQLIQSALPAVPGAGWMVSGIHSMFILLAFGLTLKPYSATAAGALKGLFEVIFGNDWLGLMMIVQSAFVGFIIDLGYFIFKAIKKEQADNDEGWLSWLIPWILCPGLGEMLVIPIFFMATGFYTMYLNQGVLWIVYLITFCSGAVFGALTRLIREVIVRAGVPSSIIRE